MAIKKANSANDGAEWWIADFLADLLAAPTSKFRVCDFAEIKPSDSVNAYKVYVYKQDTGWTYSYNADSTSIGTGGGGGSVFKTGSRLLTVPEILTIDTNPITLIASAGIGKQIEMISASSTISIYGGTPYRVSTALHIYTDTASLTQLSQAFPEKTILESTVARSIIFHNNPVYTAAASTFQTQLIENKGVLISTLSGHNPVGGNSEVKIYFSYREITL